MGACPLCKTNVNKRGQARSRVLREGEHARVGVHTHVLSRWFLFCLRVPGRPRRSPGFRCPVTPGFNASSTCLCPQAALFAHVQFPLGCWYFPGSPPGPTILDEEEKLQGASCPWKLPALGPASSESRLSHRLAFAQHRERDGDHLTSDGLPGSPGHLAPPLVS